MKDTARVKLNLYALTIILTVLFYVPLVAADSVSTKTYRELTEILQYILNVTFGVEVSFTGNE